MVQGEVITLTFGRLANFTGAHYWNFQAMTKFRLHSILSVATCDEILGLQERPETSRTASQIDTRTLYREGLHAARQSTYTPRLVLVDTCDSLGGVNLQAEFHAIPPAIDTWDGRHHTYHAPQVPKSRFYVELEGEEQEEQAQWSSAGTYRHVATEQTNVGSETAVERPLEAAARALDVPGAVRHFTDYLKAQLHPRSAQLVQGLWTNSPEVLGWSASDSWLGRPELQEDIAERIRFFAEECDSFAGFQCFVDDCSAWGSLAADVLQQARDDYGAGKAMMVYCLRSTLQDETDIVDINRRRFCDALSLATLTQSADAVVPVSPPLARSIVAAEGGPLSSLRWRSGDMYHESALYAAALDTVTLPYRLNITQDSSTATGAIGMGSMASLLRGRSGVPLAALSMAIPCGIIPRNFDSTAAEGDLRLVDTVPGQTANTSVGAKHFSVDTTDLSGLSTGGRADANRLAECVVLRGSRSEDNAIGVRTAAEALDQALLKEGFRCAQHRTVSAQPLPIPLGFPSIFESSVNEFGVVGAKSTSAMATHHVVSCPTLTRLADTAAFADALRACSSAFSSAAVSRQGRTLLHSWDIQKSRQDEVVERLAELAHAYEEE